MNFSQCYSDYDSSYMFVPINMPTPAATTAAPAVTTRAVRTTSATMQQRTTAAAATSAQPATTPVEAGVVLADWLLAVLAVSGAVALVCAVLLVALKRKKVRSFGEPLMEK